MHIFKGADLLGRGQFSFLSAYFMKNGNRNVLVLTLLCSHHPLAIVQLYFIARLFSPLMLNIIYRKGLLQVLPFKQVQVLTLSLTCIMFAPYPLQSFQLSEIYCHLLKPYPQTQEFSAHTVSKYTNPTFKYPSSNSSEFNRLTMFGKNVQYVPIFEGLSAK